MKKNDRKDFAVLLAGTAEMYDKKLSDPLTEMYWECLKKFDLCDVERAFNQHVLDPDRGQFFPKPADVVRVIEGSSETRALQAWTKVLKTISFVGRYQRVAFDDAIIHSVIDDMGGWVNLCSTEDRQKPYKVLEFQKRYRGYIANPPTSYPSHFEEDNYYQKFTPPYPRKPIALIGDTEKVKEIMRNAVTGIPVTAETSPVADIPVTTEHIMALIKAKVITAP